MLRLLPFLLLLAPALALAGAPVPLGSPHSELMDGVNTFPTSAHLREDTHSSPFGPCGGSDSDLQNESSSFHYYRDQAPFTDTALPSGHCMDVKQVWLAWDATHIYVAVQGPNSLFDNGDMFIAIDTDGATTHGTAAPWNKAVNFCSWRPEFFIAVEEPQSGASPYAALLDGSFGVIRDQFSGLLWADGGFLDCASGGMYYEFKISYADLGWTFDGVGRLMNVAVYTTYEDDGYDTYDSGPGCGQVTVNEELGDYPYDADHCGGNLDCISGVGDPGCGNAESDDALGAGVGTGGRFPASDNTTGDVDTIAEYYCVTNVGSDFPVPTVPTTWGRIKGTKD